MNRKEQRNTLHGCGAVQWVMRHRRRAQEIAISLAFLTFFLHSRNTEPHNSSACSSIATRASRPVLASSSLALHSRQRRLQLELALLPQLPPSPSLSPSAFAMSAAAVAMGAPATTFQLDYMGYAVRRRAQRANMHSAVKRLPGSERQASVL